MQVVYLNSSLSPGMPNFIDGVPALVLDYDKEIDMENDHEAQNEYATQVKAYFEFVKEVRQRKEGWVFEATCNAPMMQGLAYAAVHAHGRYNYQCCTSTVVQSWLPMECHCAAFMYAQKMRVK